MFVSEMYSTKGMRKKIILAEMDFNSSGEREFTRYLSTVTHFLCYAWVVTHLSTNHPV